jgi:hypothetical protein
VRRFAVLQRAVGFFCSNGWSSNLLPAFHFLAFQGPHRLSVANKRKDSTSQTPSNAIGKGGDGVGQKFQSLRRWNRRVRVIHAVAVHDHWTSVRLAAFLWLELSPRHLV